MEPVTMLTAKGGKTFTKAHTLTPDGWDTKQYDHVYTVDVETLLIEDLDELSALLVAIEGDPKKCIIRGKLIDPTRTENVRRLSLEHDDAAPTFQDHASRIVMLDVDDLAAPADLSMAQRVAMVIRSLPRPFQDADCHFQWSSSAEIKGWEILKAHLWFWLDDPVTTEYLKARQKAEGWKVDEQVFKVVQPHYTAAPTFTNSADPLAGQRSFFVQRKRRTVKLPAWSPPPPPVYAPPVTPDYKHDDPAYQARVQKWMAAVIDNRCRDIIDAPDGTQNPTIFRSAAKLGQLVGGGLLTHAEATDFLMAAARAGSHPEGRAKSTIRSALARGASTPIYGPPDK